MNKADPFGDMTPASDLVSGDMPLSSTPAERSEEPVQADHIGAFLCATRMRMGGDLQEIAKILRIRYGYLVAIEDGRHEDLPGNAYSVGFVRAYADYLGLDGNEVVRRLREETSGTIKTARFEFPIPSSESGLPNGGLLGIAMVMGMVVYGAWYTLTNADRDAVDLIQEVPGRLAVLIQDDDSAPQALASSAPAIPEADDTVGASDSQVVAATPESEALEITTDQAADVVVLESSQDVVAEELTEETDVASIALPDSEPDVSAAVAEDSEGTEVTETSAADVEAVEERVAAVTEPQPQPESDTEQAPAVADVPEPSEPETPTIDEPVDVAPTPVAAVEAPDVPEETVGSAVEIAAVVPEAVVDTPADVQEPDETEDLTATSATDSEPSAVTEAPADVAAAEQSEEPEVAAAVESSDVTADPAAPLVIELRAKSDSWIQVRDGNELLLTRLLREGEVYQVPDREGLTLMTGNAGGLEVFVDGEQMPPLGDVGVVRRGVPLSAERLRQGVAPG